MALTVDWKSRIDVWRQELPNHFCRPLGPVAFEGFTTRDQLTAAQAAGGPFKPMPVGTKWGAKWEYAWLRTEIVLPREAAGRRIVFTPGIDGEGVIYVGGKVAGARDHGRRHHVLTTRGKPGERFAVLIEAYAGHGVTPGAVGPTPPERKTVPEPPAAQQEIRESSLGIWDDDAFGLHLDVETLWQVRECLDDNSLRRGEIDRGLRDFTTIVDFELPLEGRVATFRAGRERLRPLLECVNGSTVPTMFACGHAHIDVAWLWPLAETERKVARTFSNQLNLMAEYPGYKFLQSQAHLYRMCKRLYPELYERVKRAVKAGQFVPEGAMWVEADTNITGGESLIRQCMHGMRFFREEFGVTCGMLWLPDVFGYSGALPQILRGCGIRYFSTAKIFCCNYQGGDPFPYGTFVWEGIDGSEVHAHLINDYNAWTHPRVLWTHWNNRPQKDGVSSVLFSYGHGDGGGGPTREHVEYLLRQRDLEGAPRARMAGPMDYFRDQESRGWPENRYVGEIYFQCHRGTYTSQARTKRGNRRCELALREAEMWGAVAGAVARFPWPAARIDEAWKQVLLCQFHDVLPGSSIARVYEEAEAAHAEVLRQAGETAAAAAGAITRPGDALTVFNSLGWERTALVALPEGWKGAAGPDGKALPIQAMGDAVVAEVRAPSCGWTSIRPCRPGRAAARRAGAAAALKVGPRLLENDLVRLEFDEAGEITSFFDKACDREIAAGPCNAMRMFKDVPSQCDAWDIDSMYALTPVALDRRAEIEVVSRGPLVASVRIRRRLHESDLVQEVRLRAGSRRVDFVTTVEWRERHKLLKVAFPVRVFANEAIHEIQFGHIRRPNHKSRPFDADRFEVAQHKWTALAEENRGVAVLNDSKYGVSVLGHTISLTLLRAAMGPDMNADRGAQVFTYALYAWNGSLADSGVVREGYDLNVPVLTAPGSARPASALSVDAPNVVIETVKPAEDGSGDVIVRVYESKRMATRAALAVSLKVRRAIETNLLEEPLPGAGPLAVRGGRIALDLRPFEIKTLRLKTAAGKRPAR